MNIRPEIWFAEEAAIYCLKCQAVLPSGQQPIDQCFDCQTPFDRTNPNTFAMHRTFIFWRYWWPGFILAVASGVISYALCLTSGELGFALFVAVPVSVGAIIGYGTKPAVWGSLFLAMLAIPAIVCMLVSVNLAGFFCGATLGIVFLIPTVFGVALGVILRVILCARAWDHACFFPLVFFIALPYLVQVVENVVPNRNEVATVQTELTVDATPEAAWNAIMFYEEVQHSPPWLLKLALPKPERSVGNKQREGEIVRCFYDRGYLVKRISHVEPNRKLAFEVTEQKLHFERDVQLKDGSFELIPVAENKTRILLTTRYERKLSPRFVWQPIEKTVVHTLHEHVLDGMRRHIDQNRKQFVPRPYEPSESISSESIELADNDS